jgi:Tfp pilus assembly protein PilO
MWGTWQRLGVAALVGALTFGAGARAWVTEDVSGAGAARAALADAQLRFDDAREGVAHLAELRSIARGLPELNEADRRGSFAGDARAIAALAASAGVVLSDLEPGPQNASATEAMRSIKLSAQADFSQLMDFLQGLQTLPTLVVPVELTLKRNADSLQIEALLRVYDHLRMPEATREATRDRAADRLSLDPDETFPHYLADPFAVDRSDAADDAVRLTGLLRDHKHALALVETSDGAMDVAAGERLLGEQVVGVGEIGLTLASDSGTRELVLPEVAR